MLGLYFISSKQAASDPLSGFGFCSSCLFKGSDAPPPAFPLLSLFNQRRRSCWLDRSIFISFIYSIFMSFSAYFIPIKAGPLIARVRPPLPGPARPRAAEEGEDEG